MHGEDVANGEDVAMRKEGMTVLAKGCWRMMLMVATNDEDICVMNMVQEQEVDNTGTEKRDDFVGRMMVNDEDGEREWHQVG